MNFEEIAAIHDEVRTFVEQEYPGYKIMAITADLFTEYHPPMHSLTQDAWQMDWPLTNVTARFKAEASRYPGIERLHCRVEVASNGQMVLTEVTITNPSPGRGR